MRRPVLILAASLGGLLTATTLPAQANGAALHDDAQCDRCHDSSVYSRAERKTKDYAGLKRKVGFCRANLGIDWFPDEEAQVVDYLNDNFYRYAK